MPDRRSKVHIRRTEKCRKHEGWLTVLGAVALASSTFMPRLIGGLRNYGQISCTSAAMFCGSAPTGQVPHQSLPAERSRHKTTSSTPYDTPSNALRCEHRQTEHREVLSSNDSDSIHNPGTQRGKQFKDKKNKCSAYSRCNRQPAKVVSSFLIY